jgi:hypothetical protein
MAYLEAGGGGGDDDDDDDDLTSSISDCFVVGCRSTVL